MAFVYCSLEVKPACFWPKSRQLGAKRLEIRCDARNLRSANAARRMSFVQEGHLRNQRISHEGKLRDTLIFSLIPADRQESGKP